MKYAVNIKVAVMGYKADFSDGVYGINKIIFLILIERF